VVAIAVLLLVAALAARLQPWPRVFPDEQPGAVFVGDTDTYYHALRAERIASDFPRVPWTDPGMNFPEGADILWPPLFDVTLAGVARVASAGPPSRATIERVAALMPPVLGLATVASVMAFGFVSFRDRSGVWAGLLLALLPIHVEFSALGRPDQHAAESLLQTLVMLTFVAAWHRPSAIRVTGLGVAIVLSFWNWQGSALSVLLLAAFVAAWHVWDGDGADRASRALAGGASVGTALLVVSIAVAGRGGALTSGSLSGINGIQAVLTALVAAFAAGLLLARRVRGDRAARWSRRVSEAALAAAVPALAATAGLSVLRAGVQQGWTALVAGNPWYASIREFQPPLFGGAGIDHELAAWLPRFAPMFVMPVAAAGMLRRWRRCPADRPALAFIALWGGLLLLATLARLRFALYLSVPAVLWCAIALAEAARGVAGRRAPPVRSALLVLLLLPAAFYFWHGGLWPDPEHREVARALAWLHDRPAVRPDRPAVFSEWDWGHLIQYYGGRPAVATPFGSDGGAGAIEDAAAFFLSTSPSEAADLLDRRRAGYLLLVDPVTHAAASEGWAPAGRPPPVRIDWQRIGGPRIEVTPEVDDLVAVRIYFDSGLSSRGAPTLTRYRFVYEGAAGAGRQVRLFEIVPGAELVVSGAPPGDVVRAQTQLLTNRGRSAPWYVDARADDAGSARLRVPFSTGENGVVTAAPFEVTCAGTQTDIVVPARAVEAGTPIDVACGGRR